MLISFLPGSWRNFIRETLHIAPDSSWGTESDGIKPINQLCTVPGRKYRHVKYHHAYCSYTGVVNFWCYIQHDLAVRVGRVPENSRERQERDVRSSDQTEKWGLGEPDTHET
jgi:hypothetical protein